MKILAIESSAHSCSVALFENKKIICEIFSDSGLTHSQTLMKMVSTLIDLSMTDFSSIDSLAVAVGPGSYTGIRIGIAAAKGLAQPGGLKCFGISTLESIAYNYCGFNCIVCAVMDARCGQVYTALFKCNKNNVTRLTDDNAMSCIELQQTLNRFGSEDSVILAGDGAEMFFNLYAENLPYVTLAPVSVRFQRASGVALCASSCNKSDIVYSEQLNPIYLRLPQAERELKKR